MGGQAAAKPGRPDGGAEALLLSAIDDRTEEGRQIPGSARQSLINLGKGEASYITAEDTADTSRIFAQTRCTGDGIIPPASADGEGTRRASKT